MALTQSNTHTLYADGCKCYGFLRLGNSSKADFECIITTKLNLNKAVRQVPSEIKSYTVNLDQGTLHLKFSFEASHKMNFTNKLSPIHTATAVQNQKVG